MVQIGIASAVVLSLVNLVLLVLVLKRFASISKDEEESSEQDELHALRQEVSRSEQEVRSEVRTSQKTITDMLVTSVSELSKTLTAQLEGTRNTIDDRFQKLQQSNDSKLEQVDRTVTKQLQSTTGTLVRAVGESEKTQTDERANSTQAIKDLTQPGSEKYEHAGKPLNTPIIRDILNSLEPSEASLPVSAFLEVITQYHLENGGEPTQLRDFHTNTYDILCEMEADGRAERYRSAGKDYWRLVLPALED